MFRLHKHRSAKSGDRIEFRISHLKALQVPKGWDKLFVSVVSVENGKTVAKSGKVSVRNGSCQWSDTFSESIWVSRDDSSKEVDDCLLKLIVAMGSLRSGILGEATVKMNGYVSSDTAIPLSIPLKKCSHGTVLHVTVQCLTPRKKLRDQESSKTNSHLKSLSENNHDASVKSEGSDISYVQSVESSSIDDEDSAFSLGGVETRETSFSGSVSNYSFNSVEGFTERGNISPCISDEQSPTGRQDSISSQKSVSHHDYPASNFSQSNHSSSNSQNMQDIGASSPKVTNASNKRLEAAEDKTEELRAEAKMWEMNARKLMGDLDMMKTEFSDQSKKLEGLEMNLSVAYAERDSFKNGVKQLKLSSEDPIVRQKALEDSISQGECIPDIENSLKDELKFQKESNANLSMQLKKSQEANIELVSVLQELEETIEQQKSELENLSSLPSKFSDLEKSFQLSIEENRSLAQQLEQLEESKKSLLVKLQELEGTLEDKMRDIEHARFPNNKALSGVEREYESKLSAKEKEILSLKTRLLESLPESSDAETMSRNVCAADLLREIKELKEKVQELETDCNELTDENLELLVKLKKAKSNSKDGDAFENKLKDQSFASFESEVSNNMFRIFHSEEMVQGGNTKKMISNGDHIPIQELETSKLDLEVRITDLNKELINKTSEMADLEANLSCKEKEMCQLETKVYHLEQEKLQLEEHMEVIIKESKHELELHVSDIERKNEQLSKLVSDLEAQLRDLTNEQESCLSELEHSRSQAARLRQKIMEMRPEMDSSIEELKQKLELTQSQRSEAQKECEYLRRENQQLHVTMENLIEKCNSFEKLNADLRQQKLNLEEHFSLIRVRLSKSDERFADSAERVEYLAKKFASMLEDIELKDKHLTSALDGILDENRKHMEQGEILLNQMQMEKVVEIQNLELEVENLNMKLSAAYNEKERIASNALLEVSSLHADKAKLESAIKEVQSELILSKTKVNMMQAQYEQKLKDLTTELADFKIRMEMQMAERESLLKLVEDYKSRELECKGTITALESKLTVTEYERQQFMDEYGNLKVQLQQAHQFENEVMVLKNELNNCSSEKKSLEASLQEKCELCEDLKAEKKSFEQRILTLEKVSSELEDCNRTRSCLEERLMQLENELKARETRYIQDPELSNVKRVNSQHQQTIQLLEQEKAEFQRKTQALEEELKLIKEQKRNQVSKINRKPLPLHDDLKASKNPLVKNTNQHRINRKKSSSKNDREIMKDQQEVETEHGLHDESVHDVEVDPVSKSKALETEQGKAKAKNIYEVQLNRSSAQGVNNHADVPVKSMALGELVTKERFEHTKSMLEAELRDIQERYFHLSLKYAEVETEREELVMKVKASNNNTNRKGWFS